tara:strand:+ start:2410 stop:3297 length:888 start_codon:yes stop_codon:yes gene_type:complete
MNSVDVSPSSGFSHIYDSMNNSLSNANPLVLVALTLIIIFYFIVFSYLGYSMNYSQTQESGGMRVVEIIMWGLIVFLVLINGIQYFFKIDVKTAINNLFKGKPEVDIKIEPEKKFVEKKGNSLVNNLEKDLGLGNLEGGIGGEVFNIPGNEYTYDEARALCKAYGAKIATYSQIENAYKSGAEWCNYGWSDSQLALFPTQKTTWNKLQKIKGHKHDCGRPGVNGGFIKNPNVRFGVNCYGNKPNITKEEQDLMKKATPYPLTEEDRRMNHLVKKYKKDLDTILVSPFNYKAWNRI